VDLSGRVSGAPAQDPGPEALKRDARTEASLEGLGLSERKEALEKRSAPGRALEVENAKTMSEEERSARNEVLIGILEKEKKAMGIARVLPIAPRPASASGDIYKLTTSPEPVAPQALGSGTPALVEAPAPGKSRAFSGTPAAEGLEDSERTAGEASGIPSPDAGLVFADGGSLSSSWTLLGLPGDYPAVDFWSRRAVVLKRSAVKIVEVRTTGPSVQVYFRALSQSETSAPAQDRFTAIPLEPRQVEFVFLPR